MTWVRRGYLHDFMVRSHAQCPTVLVLDDRLRIFYADRTDENQSFIMSIDVAREDPARVIAQDNLPVLMLGKLGTFDSDGMMPSCIVQDERRMALYYSGWNRGGSVPYRNAIGLAICDDEGFRRAYDGPVMDRSVSDPIMVVTPWVMGQQMWYVSGTRWIDVAGHLEPVYVIKHASFWGGRWVPSGHTCIKPFHENEAFSNPTVFRNETGYHMWFCSRDSMDYRGGAGSYRIHYATSADGVNWERRLNGGLDVSADGFDSEMTCYPYVVEVDGRLLMFYNGNDFGRTGIGYAEWEE